MRRALLVLFLAAAPAFADGGGLASYVEGIDRIESLQCDAAVAALSKAIEAEPENPDYYTARGVAYALGEHVAEARKDLDRSLKLRPRDDEARLWMASVVAMAGDYGNDTRYFPFATRDRYESYVRNWTKEYGWPAWDASREGRPSPESLAKRKAALEKFPEIARQFAARRKAQPEMGTALLERAKGLYAQQKYAEALVALEPVLARFPEDPGALAIHASALLGVGAPEGAREEYTRVLTWNVRDANAYIGRALAAATLGDAGRAKRDLESAAQLAPQAVNDYRPKVEKLLAALVPDTRTNDQLFSALGAQGQAKWDDLVAQALAVRRAVAGHRRLWAERYQDRLREVEWAVAAAPHDPDRLAELGDFLQANADVLSERVEPCGDYRMYRYTNDGIRARELARAAQVLDQALTINPDHVRALAARAALDIGSGQWADAETRLKHAIGIGGDIPEVLELFARVLENAASLRALRASNLRSVQSWSTYEYIYWRYPSQSEVDAAEEYDRQAKEMLDLAAKVLDEGVRKCAGTAQGAYLKGLILWHAGDLAGAKAALLQSVQLDPEGFVAHRLLATVHSLLGENEEGLRVRMIATNLIETSAAPYLTPVWYQIRTTRWDSAKKTLLAAAAFDPTDARIAAYLGVVAAGEEKMADAAAWWRVALAQEEAKARGRGQSLLPDARGTLGPDDLGLALVLSRRTSGALVALGKTDEAIQRLGYALGYERRVASSQYAVLVPRALLPDPNLDNDSMPEADNLMALLCWNRVALGAAFVQAKRWKEAEGVLLPIQGIDADKMTNGVGLDKLHKPQVYGAMYLTMAYLGLGDIEKAQQWVGMVPHQRMGMGSSLNPLAELEETGTKLQAEVDRLRQAKLETGDENSESAGYPADEEKVRDAMQSQADAVGLSSMPEQWDVADLEAKMRMAIQAILTPKSTRWRIDVVRGIGMVRDSRQGQRVRPEISTMSVKVMEKLKAFAVANGYPEADLTRDLARDPRTLEQEMGKERRQQGREAPPKDANEAQLAKICDEIGITYHTQGDRMTASAEDMLFMALQQCVRALGEDPATAGWTESVIEELRRIQETREQFRRDPGVTAKYDQGLEKMKALAVERGVPAEQIEKELGTPGRRKYR